MRLYPSSQTHYCRQHLGHTSLCLVACSIRILRSWLRRISAFTPRKRFSTAGFGICSLSLSRMFVFQREVVPSNIVNGQDQGALTTIAAALDLTTTGIFICIRLLIRWPWQSLFGDDDAAVLVASVRDIYFAPRSNFANFSEGFWNNSLDSSSEGGFDRSG